jgi:hypothetical protein
LGFGLLCGALVNSIGLLADRVELGLGKMLAYGTQLLHYGLKINARLYDLNFGG